MKRLLLIIVIAALAGLSATAQRRIDKRIYIGGKGGVLLTRQSLSPSVPQGWRLGPQVGGVFRYIEENHFGIMAELNFSQRGWKENFDGAPYSYSRSLTYIELPIMTHIYFGSERFKGFVNLGPQIGVMIANSASANFDTGNISALPDFPVNVHRTAQYALEVKNRFDYGIMAGVGMEVAFGGRHSVMLEGRFYYGLGNVFSAKRSDAFSSSSGMAIGITAAYLFRLK